MNFQQLIIDMTKLDVANASLLDEGTSAAEAMIMLFNARSRDEVKQGKNKFFMASDMFVQTIDVVEGRAKNLGIDLVIGSVNDFTPTEEYFGAMVQYCNKFGEIINLADFTESAKAAGIPFILIENGYTEKKVSEINHDYLIKDFVNIDFNSKY